VKLAVSALCLLAINLGLVLDPASASPAPVWELSDLEGETRSLDEWRGKWVLMKMGTTHCPNCAAEMEELAKIEDQIRALGVEVLDIYVREKRRSVKRYLKKHQFAFQGTVLYDWKGDLVGDYGLSIIPHLVLVDPEGRITWEAQFTPADELLRAIEAQIQPASAGVN
jgi:peroxiredoxin